MKTFSITDIGRTRESNQDYVYSSEQPVGNLPNLFLVADGMGGHNAGDYASRYTVDTIVNVISQSELTDPVELLEDAIKTANLGLIEKAAEDESRKGMGTTIVALTILGDHMYVANVGDSRLYCLNQGIRQITRDHSLVEEMVRMGEMDKSTAKDHPDKNIITRAIGASPDLNVDFFQVELESNDTILMCTDGLTNMVEDEEIRKIILGQRDTVERAERLVSTANQNGGRDNISVIVIEPFSE